MTSAPWISTTEKLPCIVAFGDFIQTPEGRLIIEENLPPVLDVLNGSAYAFDLKGDKVFKMRGIAEAAIIYFPKTIHCEGTAEVLNIVAPIVTAVEQLNKMLEPLGPKGQFTLRGLKLEVTKKGNE